MDELALSALLFHSLSAVVIVTGSAALACVPAPRRTHGWVIGNAATAQCPARVNAPVYSQDEPIDLPRAA